MQNSFGPQPPNFGGWQGNGWRRTGCTPTDVNAASRQKTVVEACVPLSTEGTIANCTENMRDIYDYITPAVWGIPDINTLKSKFESFASSRGVSLTGYKSSNGWNKTTVIQYISGGLNANSPVLLLTWNTPISELSQHWVTITRLFKDTTGANLMTTSNWGSMKTYNFDTWFDAGSIYQGVIYFK